MKNLSIKNDNIFHSKWINRQEHYLKLRLRWQDDGARIHRCPEALKAVEESFKSRIDPEIQAPKMADFWPIENVWAILKQKVASKSTNNVKELRAAITTAWIEISKDKKLCKKMIDSLPVRAQAVISKNGRQIFKKDYQ